MYPTRRHVLTGGTAAALVATLASCRNSGDSDGSPTVDYAWWSSPENDAAILAAIEQFEADHPEVTLEGEATPWDGYWDKLATMSAGGNPPDLIQMSERYLLEYGQRDALADLRSVDDIDLSNFDEETLRLGESSDGVLYGIPGGLSTFVLAANVDLFAEAGVDLPDDTTWTWSDFYEISAALADSGIVGAGYGIGIESLHPWLRQHGETMYNADGTAAGFSVEVLTSYLEHLLTLQENGGPTADQVSEDAAVPAEAGLFGTGQQGMDWAYSSTLGDLAPAADAEMRLLCIPSQTGNAAEAGMYLKGSAFHSLSAHSEPEPQAAAGQFIDFMINSADIVQEFGMFFGVPPNPDVVDAIAPDLTPMDQHVLEFVDELRENLTTDTPGPSPSGAGNVQGIFDRDVLDMLYGRGTASETAEKILEAVNNELG